MTHLETELRLLRENITKMWSLVINQLHEAQIAIETFDKGIVGEIQANEKRVDAYELKIDMDCENILALLNPVANDLRFVLSVLKINYNLERIGDYAKGIAKMIKDADHPFNPDALEKTHVWEMFDTSLKMLNYALESFDKEDNKLVRDIFKMDSGLDKVNKNANHIITELIQQYPDEIDAHLNLLSVIRKLERVGDQTKNIAEEIIFSIEAKVVRHSKNKEKI